MARARLTGGAAAMAHKEWEGTAHSGRSLHPYLRTNLNCGLTSLSVKPPENSGSRYGAMWKTRPIWPASAAQAADWPRLAEAQGSLRHDLALEGASGEPAGRGLSRLVFHIGTALLAVSRSCSAIARRARARTSSGCRRRRRRRRALPCRSEGAAPSHASTRSTRRQRCCGRRTRHRSTHTLRALPIRTG